MEIYNHDSFKHIMKENMNYEEHTNEIKRNLTVGVKTVGILAGTIYQGLKPTAEYMVRDALYSKQRKAWMNKKMKGV